MKRKRVTKFARHGALFPTEEPGRTPTAGRKRTAQRAIEVEERDVIAEYDVETPEYDAIALEY